ncbi:hypothetical protein MIR68_007651 [Amoeboaphelidium protococcarum]|nr:hypothetical protein MIR68_007651 [Amoeboaphelidium protococcarum]
MNLNKILERLVGEEIVNKRAKSYLGYEQKMESRESDNYGVYAAKLRDFVSDWLNDQSNDLPQPFDNELQQDQFWKDLIRRYLVLNSRQLSISSDQDAEAILTESVDQQSFDDLFFFVVDDYSKSTATNNSNNYNESGGSQSVNVIVRRNDADTSLEVHVAHILPSAEIRWKDTLLLNLICHLQYQIVVSKCTKNLNIQRSERQQKLKISSTTLIPLEQSVKNLYASPYKMTVMDAGRSHDKSSSSLSSHKLTYPICYFTLSDYDSASYSEESEGSRSGDIILKDSLHERDLEYLTVELILKVPQLTSGGDDTSTDMTLFQGAVSYYALREAFQTKRRQSVQFDPLQNLKNVFSSINRQFKGQQSSDIQNQDDVHQEQQFILMRGPNGKGFAQVALSEIVYEDQQVGSSQMQSIQKGLKCDMVYISLPQSSIISDILNALI